MPDDTPERTCPSCGEAYEYRLPNRKAYLFRVANEYRCDPAQHPYVYFHRIPTEQSVEVPYGGARP